SVTAMNELVKAGEDPKMAGNVVSRSAHQAQAEGLKGKELSERVRKAVQERKSEHMQMKKKMQEQAKEMKKQGQKPSNLPGKK
ncbi:MAG: hypothetical protein PHQ54_02925, partial [Candidatus Omnitrophica bacterium]|nr:hypothetical protein [Candidatus Omnitrophota bacterium]